MRRVIRLGWLTGCWRMRMLRGRVWGGGWRTGSSRQHHQLFHKRPFIWHITDHHKGGFSALVNYHKLDRAGLERLTYTYLGWWISAQEAAVRNGEAGADDRLAAAVVLQDKLKLILEGEPPFDIFVRWKTLAEQPIGVGSGS